jgi:hypothetical protein
MSHITATNCVILASNIRIILFSAGCLLVCLNNLIKSIRTDLVDVGWGDVDWIGLAQDRDRWRALVNSVLNLRVP